jgi:hypothetical protein
MIREQARVGDPDAISELVRRKKPDLPDGNQDKKKKDGAPKGAPSLEKL